MQISDLSLWEAFYWVAKDASFTKAAARLRLGTPMLSKKITRLEKELSVRLFFRSTRKLALTEEGRSLLPVVETLLEDYRGLEDRFQSGKKIAGTIRLTCTAGLANRHLAPLIVEFTEKHPDVKFEIDASDALVDLIGSQIDLAIRIQKPVESELIYKKLIPNNLIFCASPDYVRKCRLPLKTAEDLRKHPLVMFRAYERCVLTGTGLTLGDFTQNRRIDANSGTFLTELALQGAGVAIRSVWDVREFLRAGALTQVLKNVHIENPVDIYAVIPSRRLMTARVRTFLSFLEARAKNWVA